SRTFSRALAHGAVITRGPQFAGNCASKKVPDPFCIQGRKRLAVSCGGYQLTRLLLLRLFFAVLFLALLLLLRFLFAFFLFLTEGQTKDAAVRLDNSARSQSDN